MKAKTLLVAAVMFLGLSAAAFAQGTFSVGSIPVTTVTSTGYTEGAGAITFTLIQNSPVTVAGTITISYGVPITSTLGTAINVNAAGQALGVTVVTGASNNSSGVLVISIPALMPANSSFTITGVRVAVYGSGLTSLNASISSVGNAIVAGQANVVVISAIANGIGSVTSTVGAINAVAGTVVTNPVMKVKENYLNAFADSTYSQLGAGLGVWIRFTLSAAPPSGVSFSFPMTAVTDATVPGVFQLVGSDGVVATAAQTISSSSTSLVVYYQVSSSTDPAKIETLSVPVTMSISGSATLPIPQASITFTATLAPIGTAFDSNGNVISPAAGKAPRFAALEVGPANLLGVTGSNTVLLIPFASTVSAGGYNTGIAISNTTTDPGTTAMGFNTAVKQTGKITFYFYPGYANGTAGTAFTYTTAAGSPGVGLDASGNIPSGSTYSVLLSELLTAASAPADFSGYIFVITSFTNAHCQYILTDFQAFANGGQALVLNAGAAWVPALPAAPVGRAVTPEVTVH